MSVTIRSTTLTSAAVSGETDATQWILTWCPDLGQPGREQELDYHIAELHRFTVARGHAPNHATFDTWILGVGN
jgi:hypothetical protein